MDLTTAQLFRKGDAMTMNCGCTVQTSAHSPLRDMAIVYCPLHTNAKAMLAALRETVSALSAMPCACTEDRDCQRCFANRKARAAIAVAEKD